MDGLLNKKKSKRKGKKSKKNKENIAKSLVMISANCADIRHRVSSLLYEYENTRIRYI